MKAENEILYICDFSRGALNDRLSARIQHLLRGHKYRVCRFLPSIYYKKILLSKCLILQPSSINPIPIALLP